MRLINSALFAVVVSSVAVAGTPPAKTPAKTAKTKAPAKAVKAKPPAPVPMVTAEHKKALAEKFGGFKFGMSKDEVLGVLQKQIDERYEDKIKGTTDIAVQDRYRKDKKGELARISQSFIAFDAKTSPWDVSIVETEFAHNTNESMMERWENEGGKNQRRFFFFYDQKLWKMYLSLDVSIIPEEKRNFETFKSVMEGQYGAGSVNQGTISWRAGEFDVRAVDRLKDYGALGLVVEDPKVRTDVMASREAHKPPEQAHNTIINSVIDKDNKDHPDMKSNGGAVDAVIQAQGGTKK
ncbi:MAG: hypothetical protein ABI591_02135 [Kofleriaceae bacterium]